MRWVVIFDDNEHLDAIRKAHSSASGAGRVVLRRAVGPGGGSRDEAVRLIEQDPYFGLGLRKSYRLLVWGKAPCYDA